MKHPGGRPPIKPDVVSEMQELYLMLVAEGKNEIQIDAVEEMASWPTRYGWQDNEEFSTRLKRARRTGTHKRIANLENKINESLERAEDGAANGPMANILATYAKNVQWNVARLNREDYGDRTQQDTRFVDKEGNDITVNVKIGDK